MPKIYKIKRRTIWCILLLIGGLSLVLWMFHRFTLFPSNHMSLAYSHSASSFHEDSKNEFYVRDNTLYFADTATSTIRYVKNNIIRTFAKVPNTYKQFIILDESTAIVEKKDFLYLLKTSEDTLEELWPGNCVGCYGNQVYFTDDNTLYAAEIGNGMPHPILSFDKLLASYHDGIVYKNESGIYQLYLEQPDAPQLLTSSDIPWPEVSTHFPLGDTYLYTSDYAFHISTHTLDMYIYQTGEMRRIFETNTDGMVIMALVARKDTLYISRQLTDIKFWPQKNKEINGTYRYDTQTDSWTKISNKAYSVLVQFDEEFLYGVNTYSVLGGIRKIKAN